MQMKIRDLVQQARDRITCYDARAAIALRTEGRAVFVDVRDVDEIRSTGSIPASIHISRGMLELCVASDSPYHESIFGDDREFVFYCQSGMRSALAACTARDLGVTRAASLDGGITAWRSVGGEIERSAFLAPIMTSDLIDIPR